MDILDLVDTGEVDSKDEDEVEETGDLPLASQHGITKEILEANYQMLGSVAPQEESSISLVELRVKYPQVY